MIDLPLRVDMLAWPHDHGLGRVDVDQRGGFGVIVRYPYRYGEAIGRAAEEHR